MAVVGGGHDYRIGLYLIEHLDVVRKELHAGRRRCLCFLYELGMQISNSHQLGVWLIGDDLEQSPNVIVIESHNGKARPGLAGGVRRG